MSLINNLKPASNSMATFYPISTNENSNDFNWDTVTNLFLKELYGLVSENKIETELKIFHQEFEEKFKHQVSDRQAWQVIENIYFLNKSVAKISPKLRIFSLSDDTHNLSAERRIVSLLKTLLKRGYVYQDDVNNLNFIEQLIFESFEKMFPSNALDISGINSYLPKLSTIFSEDLIFLTTNSKYFLENIQLFIEIYICIYTAQLSIVINSWREAKEPEIKDCYFILDTERASRERVSLQRSGYKLVEKGLESIFPILALTESLQSNVEQKVPLWQLRTTLTDQDIEPLKKYCQDFSKDRGLPISDSDLFDLSSILDELQRLYKAQFAKGETRASRNVNVVRAIKNIILKPFTQSRGSAGTVFVLTQEYLLLLTNLVIGKREKLRLYEVIKELELRGIFFDKESRKALVEFYERLGNVEKMSDSGDAIYVKKTI
ncbi:MULTISPECIES: DNA phosphorothioation-dependent restriction protein DptG [unclassified Acinetobacter]|uniref:DNA phosphorothioation-dependent restriction protein DptG n=1 Tax=unclassified Acinetobacter TaxID=196816 RepID=UPI00190BD067|nr:MULTISPECIES: DNA phosphorothioation-dependent restriction protein DptG [unclassified Acinetobacter]MBK0063450.1 DNA phosphorothioation-dependent restriction protein DptG [Acinetobacter sp. S55]MBK0065479.1 DNA phosphorothioation-dependent restriction protein DptG [Acinetobacter sp. S54]